MIGIRVDGNEKIGTGHIMRMLSVARELRKMNKRCVFISVDSCSPIIQAGFECEKIQGVYDNLSNEVPQIIELIKKYKISTLLIDTYFATDDYFSALNPYTKTAYVFDFGVVPCKANMLINYNIIWEDFVYPKNVKCLLGCKNAPLREEFTNLNIKRDYSYANTVMLTTGGTDPYNITGILLKHITSQSFFDAIKFNVVIGRLNGFAEEIKSYASPNITCIQNASNMEEIMAKSHICICAGGTTLYELCYMALPSITFSFAENQEKSVCKFVEKGLMLKGGNYFTDDIYPIITENLKKLLTDASLRKTLGESACELVGKNGAKNIAEFIL